MIGSKKAEIMESTLIRFFLILLFIAVMIGVVYLVFKDAIFAILKSLFRIF